MTGILVFTTFVAFLVVDRFSNRQAAIDELQAAFLAETGANKHRPMVVSPVASDAAGQEAADHRFQFRGANDRRHGDRSGDRRGQRDQSAA